VSLFANSLCGSFINTDTAQVRGADYTTALNNATEPLLLSRHPLRAAVLCITKYGWLASLVVSTSTMCERK
jgi:hypothetical protein